tara:strand:- start:2453 stop:2743 length:291 start_codon:yes stop_codon:yes gene_type:complete
MENQTGPLVAVSAGKPTPKDFTNAVEFNRIAAEINVLLDKLADLQAHCREVARTHPDGAYIFLGVEALLIDLEGENLLLEEIREFEAAADRWEDAT